MQTASRTQHLARVFGRLARREPPLIEVEEAVPGPADRSPPLSDGAMRNASALRFLCLIVALLALTVSFWPTLWSMVSIWLRSETFAHGFVIFPISLFLIWRKRDLLSGIPYRTDFRALIVIPILGFIWLLAN